MQVYFDKQISIRSLAWKECIVNYIGLTVMARFQLLFLVFALALVMPIGAQEGMLK